MKKGLLIAMLVVFLVTMSSVSAVDMFLNWDDGATNARTFEEGAEISFSHAAAAAFAQNHVYTTVILAYEDDLANPLITFYDQQDLDHYAVEKETFSTAGFDEGNYIIYGVSTEIEIPNAQDVANLDFVIVADDGQNTAPYFDDVMDRVYDFDVTVYDGATIVNLPLWGRDADQGEQEQLSYGLDPNSNTDPNLMSCNKDYNGVIYCDFTGNTGTAYFNVTVSDGRDTVVEEITVILSDGPIVNDEPYFQGLVSPQVYNLSQGQFQIDLGALGRDDDNPTTDLTYELRTAGTDATLLSCSMNNEVDGVVTCNMLRGDDSTVIVAVVKDLVSETSQDIVITVFDDTNGGGDNNAPIVNPPQTTFVFDENDGLQTIIDLKLYTSDPDNDTVQYFGIYSQTDASIADCDDNNNGVYTCDIGAQGTTNFTARVSDGNTNGIVDTVFTIVVTPAIGNGTRPQFVNLPFNISQALSVGSLSLDLATYVDFPNLVTAYTIDETGLDSTIDCDVTGSVVQCTFTAQSSSVLGVAIEDNQGQADSAAIIVEINSDLNQPPTINLPPQIPTNLTAGSYSVDLSQYATDEDVLSLTYTLNALLLNPAVANCSITGAQLDCTLNGAGFFDLEVTVDDGVNAVDSDTALFIVSDNSNQPPMFVNLPTTLSYQVTDPAQNLNLVSYVTDDNMGSLTYAINTSTTNTSVANVIITGAIITITPVNLGTTQFEVIVDDGEFTVSQMVTVEVTAGAGNDYAIALINGPAFVFVTDTVSFDGLSSTGAFGSAITDYAWTILEDGTTGTGASFTNTFNTAGNFTLLLSVDDALGFSNTTTMIVQVVTDPVAVITAPNTVTAGDEFDFDGSMSVTSPLRTITDYEWRILDDDDDELTTPVGVSGSYTIFEEGTYTIELTITDSAGDSATATHTLVVTEASTDGGANLKLFGQEDGLKVNSIDVHGFDFERAYPGDILTVSTIVENNGREDIEHVRLVYTIPELGYQWKSNAIALEQGDRDRLQLNIFLPEYIEPGVYYPIVSLSGDDIRRSKPGYLEVYE